MKSRTADGVPPPPSTWLHNNVSNGLTPQQQPNTLSTIPVHGVSLFESDPLEDLRGRGGCNKRSGDPI